MYSCSSCVSYVNKHNYLILYLSKVIAKNITLSLHYCATREYLIAININLSFLTLMHEAYIISAPSKDGWSNYRNAIPVHFMRYLLLMHKDGDHPSIMVLYNGTLLYS